MNEPFVMVVILHFGRVQDTLECLESLSRNDYKNFKTIVLNSTMSRDATEIIRTKFPEVELIELSENLGYAGNNNIGIGVAVKRGADWVFVLNYDTILDPACLTNLVKSGKGHPEIGIVGPLVYHHDEPNVIQSAGGMLGKYWQSSHLGKDQLDQGQFTSLQHVDWISGCAILVRRTLIEQVGMLDQNYFLYWEETEWCIRAAKAGWQIVHQPAAKLWHKGVRRNYQPKPSFTYYGTRNHLLTLCKHNAPLRARVFTWLQIMRTLASWSIRPKWRNKRDHRDAMWRGVVDYLQRRWGQMSS